MVVSGPAGDAALAFSVFLLALDAVPVHEANKVLIDEYQLFAVSLPIFLICYQSIWSVFKSLHSERTFSYKDVLTQISLLTLLLWWVQFYTLVCLYKL
jgi:hypothetical protein